jgi:hypothetical protein
MKCQFFGIERNDCATRMQDVAHTPPQLAAVIKLLIGSYLNENKPLKPSAPAAIGMSSFGRQIATTQVQERLL